MKDLNLLQESGVFLIVLECTVEKLAKKIIDKSKIPIISIGASKDCHGQILVVEDLLGLTDFESKFLKKYTNLKKLSVILYQNLPMRVKKKKISKQQTSV